MLNFFSFADYEGGGKLIPTHKAYYALSGTFSNGLSCKLRKFKLNFYHTLFLGDLIHFDTKPFLQNWAGVSVFYTF